MATYQTTTARKRPFRIYHEQLRKTMRGRTYAYALNAHNQALIIAKWHLPIGKTLTVLDADGNVLGQYTRKVNAVKYMGPKNLVGVEQQQNAWRQK